MVKPEARAHRAATGVIAAHEGPLETFDIGRPDTGAGIDDIDIHHRAVAPQQQLDRRVCPQRWAFSIRFISIRSNAAG